MIPFLPCCDVTLAMSFPLCCSLFLERSHRKSEPIFLNGECTERTISRRVKFSPNSGSNWKLSCIQKPFGKSNVSRFDNGRLHSSATPISCQSRLGVDLSLSLYSCLGEGEASRWPEQLIIVRAFDALRLYESGLGHGHGIECIWVNLIDLFNTQRTYAHHMQALGIPSQDLHLLQCSWGIRVKERRDTGVPAPSCRCPLAFWPSPSLPRSSQAHRQFPRQPHQVLELRRGLNWMYPAQPCDTFQGPEVTGISGGKVNVSPMCPLTSWDPNDSEGLWTSITWHTQAQRQI